MLIKLIEQPKHMKCCNAMILDDETCVNIFLSVYKAGL